MTNSRAMLLVGLFAGLALAVVMLRAEQTRLAAKAVNLELKQIEARRELWSTQAAVARLRTPGQIRNRLERFDTNTVPAIPASHMTPGPMPVDRQKLARQ